ncbi:MAG: ACP S-malonyltransferase [Fastidiosipilaceae bacterium]|jgi:[acyl-carrier-protein] S-malonyltransferase
MTVCVFSGQGAQYEGMGKDLANSNKAAARVYEECGEYLGYDLLALNAEQLTQTKYSQPATVVLSLAAFAAWQNELDGALPQGLTLAGFSLGEYSALGASGALTGRELMSLLERRSELMQAACELNAGAMYAILGLDDEVVEEICARPEYKETVFPANYNCPGQLVISGYARETAEVAERCKSAGARRAAQLSVAGAFHTPLMDSAAVGLKSFASAMTFGKPEFPMYSNVTGELLTTEIDFPSYLADHMVSPVRWTKEVLNLIANGKTDFIEFGPGKTLTGLIRKIDRQVNTSRVENSSTLNETLANHRD